MTETEVPIDLSRFCEFFEDRLSFVERNSSQRIEATILVCTYLDALAGYRYGGHSNRSRFRRFLIDDTAHADTWGRVSLILLRRYVEGKHLKLYTGLIGILNRLGAVETRFVDICHNPDLSLKSLLKECSAVNSHDEISLLESDIRRFEYATILWNAYRNGSVHETAVKLNPAVNLLNQSTPFYSHQNLMADGGIVSSSVEFEIPLPFLIATARSGLKRIKCLVEAGECQLLLSATYDRPTNSSTGGIDTDAVSYPLLVTKPCRPLLSDIGHLLDQARISHDLFSSTNEGSHRGREGAMSRSAITTSVFFLESLVHCIITDFKTREPYQLPEVLLKKLGLIDQTFERLSLIDRVLLIPYLCCPDESRIASGFFDKGAKQFQLLKELVNIRDHFAHSRAVHRMMTITRTETQGLIADDQYNENFWPVTQFPKDIFIIELQHALRAKEIVDWAVQQLDCFLEGAILKDDWIAKERIKLGPSKQQLDASSSGQT